MTDGNLYRDLVVLVADKNMEFAMKGILNRYETLGIRDVTSVFHVHPEHDPGCLLRGHLFLRLFAGQYSHALVVLDHEGSGQEGIEREALESHVEERLSHNGWGNRAAAIVIEPELEKWVWSDSPRVDATLGWEGNAPALRDWLLEKGFLRAGEVKPDSPKDVLELALRTARKPRSSSLYLQLAQRVSLNRCVDPSFIKLKTVLQRWFSTERP